MILILLLINFTCATKLLNVSISTLWSPRLVEFPPAPVCINQTSQKASHKEMMVEVWEVDPTISVGIGEIRTTERIETECTIFFFGGQERMIKQRQAVPTDKPCIDFHQDPVFLCSWLSTNTQTSDVCSSLLVDIYLNADGLIWANGKTWMATGDSSQYQSGDAWLIIKQFKSSCPLHKWLKEPAIVTSFHQGMRIVSIPSKNLLFSLKAGELTFCNDSSNGFQLTNSGYFILMKNFEVKRTNPINWLRLEPKNKLIPLINSALHDTEISLTNLLGLIYHDMCLEKQTEWKSLMTNPSAHQIASYYTEDPYAYGEEIESHFQIYKLKTSFVLVPEERIKPDQNGLIRLETPSKNILVEPLSGLIGLPGSRWKISIPLLKLANHGFYNIRTHDFTHSIPEQIPNLTSSHFIVIQDMDTQMVHLTPIKIAEINQQTIYTNPFKGVLDWIIDLKIGFKIIMIIGIILIIVTSIKMIASLKSRTGLKRESLRRLTKI